MNVSIPPGTEAVPLQAGQGAALCTWDAAEVVTLAAAPPSGQSRIDLIVCQVRDNQIDGGANNDFVFAAVTGVPAASNPAVPATPANAYVLTNATVPGAVANLNTATLKDMRALLNARDVLHAEVARAANLTIGAANQAVLFDTVNRDPLGLWKPAVPGFVVPQAGLYLVQFTMTWAGPNTVYYGYLKNGAVYYQNTPNGTGANSCRAGYVAALAAGDSIDAYLNNQSGTGVTAGNGGPQLNVFSIDYLGTG
jgi:hypothetical protein